MNDPGRRAEGAEASSTNGPTGSAPTRATGAANWPMRLSWGVVGIGVVLLAIGGVGLLQRHRHPAGPSTTSTSLPAVAGPFAKGRTPLPGFGEEAVRIRSASGRSKVLCMLLARTLPQQERGLMTVRDPKLGGYDGMLFAFPTTTTGGFWMRNTPMPLSIAYLDGQGRFVSQADMAPCADVPTCRSYDPKGPYRMAVEVPQGHLALIGLGPSSTLVPDGRCAAA